MADETKDQELVHVEELVWEEEKLPDGQMNRTRVKGIGNAYEVTKAEALEGVQAGNYRIAGQPIGKLPEGLEPAKGGKGKVAESAEDHG